MLVLAAPLLCAHWPLWPALPVDVPQGSRQARLARLRPFWALTPLVMTVLIRSACVAATAFDKTPLPIDRASIFAFLFCGFKVYASEACLLRVRHRRLPRHMSSGRVRGWCLHPPSPPRVPCPGPRTSPGGWALWTKEMINPAEPLTQSFQLSSDNFQQKTS